MARRLISVDDFGRMEIDDENDQLYWAGKAVVLERKLRLEGWTLVLAAVATASGVVAALWPILVHYKLV